MKHSWKKFGTVSTSLLEESLKAKSALSLLRSGEWHFKCKDLLKALRKGEKHVHQGYQATLSSI